MWIIQNNKKVFSGGHFDYKGAEKAALSCTNFSEDYEEEQEADEPISCYNCRYRRWTSNSFICMKGD